MRRLISVDPLTGTRAYVDYDEAEDAMHFIEEQDVTQLLALNRAMYNEAPTGWGDGATAARLPLSLWMRLKREGVLDDPKRWRRWLNNSENRHFRIRPGWI